MRLEDLPAHHLDVLIDVHVIGSKVRRCGKDRYGVEMYVRNGTQDPEELEIPEWSTSPEQSQRLMDLYQARGRGGLSGTPREVVVSILKSEGVAKTFRKS